MAGSNFFTPVTATLKAALTDENGLIVYGSCVGTPPTTTLIFAHGALLIQTDTSTGSQALYENVGSSASPSWNLIGAVSPGEITLAEGSVLVGNSSGVAAALDAKTSGRILVGNGTTITSVAVGTDATLSSAGALTIAAGVVTRAKMTAAGGSKSTMSSPATIATTGNTDGYVIVPETGAVSSIDFSGVDVLAANDTNFITFSVTNLGQAGAGSTAVLAATAANTTQVTGGTALAANTKRTLTLNGTPANLDVVAGDRLRIRAAATGTLANTVTFPSYIVRYSGTT